MSVVDRFKPFYINNRTGQKDTPRYILWYKLAKSAVNIAAMVLFIFSCPGASSLPSSLRKLNIVWTLLKVLEVLKDVLPFFDARQKENRWMAVLWWQCLCSRAAGAQLWDKWSRYFSSIILSLVMAGTVIVAFFMKPSNVFMFPLAILLALDVAMGAYVCVVDEYIVDRSLSRNRPDIELEIEDIEDAAVGFGDEQRTKLLGQDGKSAWKKMREEDGLQAGTGMKPASFATVPVTNL